MDQTITQESENLLEELRGFGRFLSIGWAIEEEGAMFNAWVNYEHGADMGGNWNAYASTPDKAIAMLHQQVINFKNNKK